MKNKKSTELLLFLMSLLFSLTGHANTCIGKLCHPFYVGISGGYGSTTWEGLVPSRAKQNAAINLSTPKYVDEGGGVWGIFAGYEFFPYFALEGNYQRYPDAKITFDPESIIAFDYNITSLNTHTETIALLAKIMLMIPHTEIRAYSSVGAAGVHRYDDLIDKWRLTPSFGAGFSYNFTDRIMGELGATYTSGYGEAELNPTDDYIPFLYSVFFRLAFRF